MEPSENQHFLSEYTGIRNQYFKQNSIVSGMYCKHSCLTSAPFGQTLSLKSGLLLFYDTTSVRG